ncbi:MAG: integral membrane sensor signal transduction histidine kinase [Puniceicoccaceae bacterium 5H]|nr:MAG: integral membrane sensor signal transduction histidine kinase [Puniceicoccaceae bacterium 5H]
MRNPFQSIRWRLQAWHGLFLLVVIAGFCYMAYQLAWNNQSRRIARNVFEAERHLFHPLFEAARPEGADEDAPVSSSMLLERLRAHQIELPPETLLRFESTESGFAYFVLYDTDGSVLMQSPNLPPDMAPLPNDGDDYDEDMRTIDNRREMARYNAKGVSSIVGRDITPEKDDLHRLGLSLAASGLGVWIVGLLGGWWLAGRALKPIHTISQTATRIAEGNLTERIDTAGNNELHQLARVLNDTFEQLHAAFERQRRFTADASHELRTPVTILLAETERILKRERKAAEYQEALTTCRESATRMRNLIQALLLLSRQESAPPQRESCDLAKVVGEAVAQLEPLAREREVHLQTDLPHLACQADPAALSILASNLVANGIQYNRPGGSVAVSLQQRNGSAVLTVQDDGPGIPQEDLPHIFDRFYRADKARTGTSGHTGLGLAIVKTIVENHQGTLAAESPDGAGARFVVSLPVEPTPQEPV